MLLAICLLSESNACKERTNNSCNFSINAVQSDILHLTAALTTLTHKKDSNTYIFLVPYICKDD